MREVGRDVKIVKQLWIQLRKDDDLSQANEHSFVLVAKRKRSSVPESYSGRVSGDRTHFLSLRPLCVKATSCDL